MAIEFEQVDESEKGKPGVEEQTTTVTVGGRSLPVTLYGRMIRRDDLNPEITEDVREVQLLVPVLTDEEYETGEENEDGSKTIAIRQTLVHERMSVDLGPESMAAFKQALAPFADVARKVEEPAPKKRGRPAKKTAASTPPATS